jgi:hypothetical protein
MYKIRHKYFVKSLTLEIQRIPCRAVNNYQARCTWCPFGPSSEAIDLEYSYHFYLYSYFFTSNNHHASINTIATSFSCPIADPVERLASFTSQVTFSKAPSSQS